jgi:hypothetical protein
MATGENKYVVNQHVKSFHMLGVMFDDTLLYTFIPLVVFFSFKHPSSS